MASASTFLIVLAGCQTGILGGADPGPQGVEIIEEEDDRSPYMHGGTPTSALPAVGILSNGCTASLIGKSLVLTAAHCKDQVTFINLAGKSYSVTKVVPHPSFSLNNLWGGHDVALVFLSKSVSGVAPLSISAVRLAPGTPVTVIGYGRNEQNVHGQKAWGTTKIDAVVDNLYESTADTKAKNPKLDGGDSGGPLLVLRSGKYSITGVASFVTDKGSPTGKNYHSRIDVDAAWIRKTSNNGGSTPSLDAGVPPRDKGIPPRDTGAKPDSGKANVGELCRTFGGQLGICQWATMGCAGTFDTGNCVGGQVKCCAKPTNYGACLVNGQAGTCIDIKQQSCGGTTVAGKCPGSSNIQCCLPKSTTPPPPNYGACTYGGQSGTCMDVYQQSCSGTTVSGQCPGGNNIKCCLPKSTTPPPPPPPKYGSCSYGGQSGTCIDVYKQSCSGSTVTGQCPGANNIRCCLPKSSSPPPNYGACYHNGKAGTCINLHQQSCGGSVISGKCPGANNIKCCLP